MAARKTTRSRKKPAPASTGLAAGEVIGADAPREVTDLARAIATDGGSVLASYREPFGGHWVVFAALPLEVVAPTPYQRELSKTHADRLAGVMGKVGYFLDPIVAVRAPPPEDDDAEEEATPRARYWTPNGMHRLHAIRALGGKSIMALVVPDAAISYRILALNTEKAHNLKDKSLEVVRMAHALAGARATASRPEKDWAFEFEEPAYLTIGLCYEENPRYSGGAYMPVVKRCEDFLDVGIAQAMKVRQKRRDKLLELDAAVNEAVEALKAAGLKSAYLKPFVVARVNPLRWIKAAKPGQPAPRAELEPTIAKMIASARKLDASKVRPQDLAAMAAAPPPEE